MPGPPGTVRAVAQAIEAKDDEAAPEAAPAANPAAAAWIVVLVIGGLAAALLLTMAFSATNTGQSIDGRTATSWSPEPND
jgi:hypothetical protein